MPRMLGTCQRPWCPYCHRPAGPDCPDASRPKKSARAREKRAWRRDIDPERPSPRSGLTAGRGLLVMPG